MIPKNPLARPTLALFCLALLGGAGVAEARTWTSADGKKTFEGDFVKLEGSTISIKRADGTDLAFPLDKLSASDRVHARELAEEMAAAKKPGKDGDSLRADLSVFDLFTFGETREQVQEKLVKSDKVDGGMVEAFLARTGLNGIFYLELDGIRFDLFFNFNDDDRLREIVLQSSSFEPEQYDGALKKAWSRLRSTFAARFGEPTLDTGYPPSSQISEGVSMSSDIWRLSNRYMYLGTGMIEGQVSCVLRCAREEYKAPEPEAED